MKIEITEEIRDALQRSQEAWSAYTEALDAPGPHDTVTMWRLQDASVVANRDLARLVSEAASSALAGEGAPHPDDAAVDRFAQAMKDKLAAARERGRSGWDSPDERPVALAHALIRHVAKGDPRDVANFAMFLHERPDGRGALAQAAVAVGLIAGAEEGKPEPGKCCHCGDENSDLDKAACPKLCSDSHCVHRWAGEEAPTPEKASQS